MATYQVRADGTAPPEAKVGDSVVTGNGTWTKNADGTTSRVSDVSTSNYTGAYDTPGASAPSTNPSPASSTGGGASSGGGGRQSTLGGFTGSMPTGFTGSTTPSAPVSVDAQAIIDQMNANSKNWHTQADATARGALEDENQNLAKQLQALVESGGDGATYTSRTTYTPTYNAELGTWQVTPNTTQSPVEVPQPEMDKINHVDTTNLQSILNQMTTAAQQQANGSVDNATQLSITELERAMQDAAGQYQTQRNQVSADEQQALDNQALSSQLKGDKGGIGNAQYAAIQNTAAQNRLAVNQAQTKLSTDTARQISDLRAQGEFEKADKMLEITQSYLSQLMSLEQWAMETNLGVDEFNSQLQQWEAEYNLSVQQFKTDTELSRAQITGQFSDGTTTLQAQNALNERLASSGEAMLGMGIMPSDEQLAAMQMSKEQAQAYITAAQLAAAAKSSGSGSGSGKSSGKGSFAEMLSAGITSASGVIDYLQSNGITLKNDVDPYAYADDYLAWLDEQNAGATTNSTTTAPSTKDSVQKFMQDNFGKDPAWRKAIFG